MFRRIPYEREKIESSGDVHRLPAGLDTNSVYKLTSRLQQAQLAGMRYRFGAPLDAEFGKDLPIVSLHRVQGEKESPADLPIRETLGDELQYF